MKTNRIILATAVFLLPFLARSLWFYQGFYQPSREPAAPDFSEMSLPIPVLSTPLPAPDMIKPSGQLILFDQQHANLFNLSEVDSLLEAIRRQGAGWSVIGGNQDLAQELKRADSYVVIAPTQAFTDTEIEAVRDFTSRGGRLLVITDPTRDAAYYGSSLGSDTSSSAAFTSTAISNLLLNPFDISISDDYLYNLSHNEGNFRHVLFETFADNDLTKGLKEVVFYSAHSIVTGSGALITAGDGTFSSQTDAGGGLAVASLAGDGHVLALGDLTFLSPPYSQVADNQKFIQNLAVFLAKTARPASLPDFPHLFSRDLSVIHDPDIDLDPAILSQISTLQETLRQDGLSVKLAEIPMAGSDLLAIGLFPPSDEIEPLIKDFDLQFSEDDVSSDDLASKAEDATDEAAPSETPEISETALPAEIEQSSAVRDTDLEANSFFDSLDSNGNGGSIEIPGLGTVPMESVSLILFDSKPDRNTLLLLAKDAESIEPLLARLNQGDLSGCLVKDNIAVCGSPSASG